ncbi:MAG: FGGY family carbohydrate kinase, partial [Oscillospiraceae bacterium]|nr:FGGY family carbohydrate kinase [Oscillospiraceae bacterium]
MKYVVALDQGTTSSRAILFDAEQNIVSLVQKEFTQIYPEPGFVEHDPLEIYSSQYGVFVEALTKSGVEPDDVAAIGITNQRETTIMWDRHTGEPVYNAIVWQCRRTAPICEKIKKRGLEPYIKKATGLVVDAYFSATKIMWILDNVPGVRKRAEAGDILFGTVDTWLIWKLSGGKAHVTDYTNASRTMLFNINTLRWDEKLLAKLNIPPAILPEVKNSSEIYATTNVLGREIPIAGIAGDQHAALFGQRCFSKGEAKNTYGTG